MIRLIYRSQNLFARCWRRSITNRSSSKIPFAQFSRTMTRVNHATFFARLLRESKTELPKLIGMEISKKLLPTLTWENVSKNFLNCAVAQLQRIPPRDSMLESLTKLEPFNAKTKLTDPKWARLSRSSSVAQFSA